MSGISSWSLHAIALSPGWHWTTDTPSIWVVLLVVVLPLSLRYIGPPIGRAVDRWLDEIEQRQILREAWRTARPCPRCRTMPDAMFLDCSRPGDCVYAEEEPPPEDESYLPPALVSSHVRHSRA
jgi:hypothetical protein